MIYCHFCLLTLLLSLISCTPDRGAHPDKFHAELLIIGGTESGWAAAIQAARMGISSIAIVHDGAWLGGQFTEQALACVDENKGVGKVGWGVDWHPMKRSFHRSGLFKELMDRIETFNKIKYGSGIPGKPYHGPSTFRPVEAEAIFREMLQPYIESGQVQVFQHYYPSQVRTEKNHISEIFFRSLRPGEKDLVISPEITIDASDWGEVIQLSGAAYECGPDPKSRYDEPGAPEDITAHPPNEMNPITWTMNVEETESEQPIPQPSHYDDRNYARTTRLSHEEMKDLDWDRHTKLGSIQHWPDKGEASHRQLSVFTVRRIVDGYTSKEGKTLILLAYMLGQDYPLERLPQRVIDALEKNQPGTSQKNIVQMTRDQRDIIFSDAKQHALGVLYHLQTFVHDRAPDKTHSFRKFQLSNEFGTQDHLPFKPYIRESLRLKAMYMMREQDGRNTDGPTKKEAREAFAKVMYPDGILPWQFHYDFHRTGRTYLKSEGRKGPWIDHEKGERHTKTMSDRSVFPLRSLIPIELDGLLGAQKNLGYSSIVSAAIRLHDQCIYIGQAAGATAAISLQQGIQLRDIPLDPNYLEMVREALGGAAAETPMLLWPYRDLSVDLPQFVPINRLAARGVLTHHRREIDFKPDSVASQSWKRQVLEACLSSLVTDAPYTSQIQALRTLANSSAEPGESRAEFAEKVWQYIQHIPLQDYDRKSEHDADLDGIPDQKDALPFQKASMSWGGE